MPPPPAHLALYRRIATVFVLLTVVMAGLVLYVILSRATVIILARQDEVKLESVVDVARQPIEGEIAGDAIELADEVSQKFPSTSVVKVDVPAEGQVKITSTFSRAQTFVATTRLLTPDNVLFRLKKTVVVPASGSVTADVFADQVGASGAVGSITFSIPGLQPESRKFFNVSTIDPIYGGVKDVRLVTQSDVDSAAEVLKEKLTKEMTEKLRAKAAEAGSKEMGEIITVDVLDQTVDAPVGAEAPEFTMTMKLQASGIFYDRAAFDKIVTAKLKEMVPFDRQLLRVEKEATTMSVEKSDPAVGRANLRIAAKGLAAISPEAPVLDPAKLAGVTVDAAQSYLEKIDGVSSASIKLSPFWSNRLPNIAEHIKVEVR
jgi:hypothetical protein